MLVFGHWLEVGGTQVNAIELSAALRDLYGHDVTYFATPGPMLDVVREHGLRFLPAPEAKVHPSPARMSELGRILRRERFDVVHAWDWWQCLDAYYVTLAVGIPLAVTDMSMFLQRVLPKTLPGRRSWWTRHGRLDAIASSSSCLPSTFGETRRRSSIREPSAIATGSPITRFSWSPSRACRRR